MKKNLLLIGGAILFCLVSLMGPINSYADEGNVGYNIQAVLPSNQIDNGNSYFDLRMSPGQEQIINIVINNTSDQDTEFQVSINQAYTNKQGFIDYTESKEVEKNNYPYKLTDIASVDSKVTVKQHSTTQVPIKLQMPKEKFDGQILGAVQVLKNSDNSESGITNSYGYVLGLKLTETDETIKRELTLNDIKAAASFGKTSVVAVIENPTMDAIGHLKYDAIVTNSETNEEIRKVSYDNDMEIAPNSIYDFAIDWDNKRLEAGEYKLHLEVKDAKENVWTFDKNFTITRDQAKEVNDVTIDAAKQNDIPTWVFILIGGLLAVILLAIFWIILMKRRKKDDEENQ